jgi:hypothetical protein
MIGHAASLSSCSCIEVLIAVTRRGQTFLDQATRRPMPVDTVPATTAAGFSLSPTATQNPAYGDKSSNGPSPLRHVNSERVPSPSRYHSQVSTPLRHHSRSEVRW